MMAELTKSDNVAFMAAQAWAQSSFATKRTPEQFGKDVAEVYRACLAEIEGKSESARSTTQADTLAKVRTDSINHMNSSYWRDLGNGQNPINTMADKGL